MAQLAKTLHNAADTVQSGSGRSLEKGEWLSTPVFLLRTPPLRSGHAEYVYKQ